MHGFQESVPAGVAGEFGSGHSSIRDRKCGEKR